MVRLQDEGTVAFTTQRGSRRDYARTEYSEPELVSDCVGNRRRRLTVAIDKRRPSAIAAEFRPRLQSFRIGDSSHHGRFPTLAECHDSSLVTRDKICQSNSCIERGKRSIE